MGKIKWTKWKVFWLSYREKIFASLFLTSLSPLLPTIFVDLNSSPQILISGENSAPLGDLYHHKEASLENSLYKSGMFFLCVWNARFRNCSTVCSSQQLKTQGIPINNGWINCFAVTSQNIWAGIENDLEYYPEVSLSKKNNTAKECQIPFL